MSHTALVNGIIGSESEILQKIHDHFILQYQQAYIPRGSHLNISAMFAKTFVNVVEKGSFVIFVYMAKNCGQLISSMLAR